VIRYEHGRGLSRFISYRTSISPPMSTIFSRWYVLVTVPLKLQYGEGKRKTHDFFFYVKRTVSTAVSLHAISTVVLCAVHCYQICTRKQATSHLRAMCLVATRTCTRTRSSTSDSNYLNLNKNYVTTYEFHFVCS
jgi:hypothetical protein